MATPSPAPAAAPTVTPPAPASFDPTKAHTPKATIPHSRQLTRARYSPDGRFIIATGMDKLLHVWEIATLRHYTLPGHVTWISALALHPTETIAYTADYHGTIRAWSWQQENSGPLYEVTADARITRALAVSPDGHTLYSGGDDSALRIHDAASGKELHRCVGHRGAIYSIGVHPDGQHIVSGDLFGKLCQWTNAGQHMRELDASALHTRKENFIADVGGVRCIAFSQDGHLMAVGGLSEAESNAFCPGTPLVNVYEWNTGVKKSQHKLDRKSDGPINALRYLTDGTLVGAGEHLNAPTALALWKLDQETPFLQIVTDSVYDLDLHPNGRQLVAPVFKSMGSGGNGARKNHKEKYVANAAELRFFHLHA